MKYNYNSISFIYTINKQCRQASGHDQEDQKGHNEHFPFMENPVRIFCQMHSKHFQQRG